MPTPEARDEAAAAANAPADPLDDVDSRAHRDTLGEIPGILQSRGRPIIHEFNGEPYHIGIRRTKGSFEFSYAEIGLGTSSVTGRGGPPINAMSASGSPL